ncbi:MAG: indole-3-glycerol-phosphate synthase [Methanophagales archaeon ANME-1-THS]|nr:MAG: indole-3-glycerol-phosphate synthase [Methanophagales archaeon ANME-1-THS]
MRRNLHDLLDRILRDTKRAVEQSRAGKIPERESKILSLSEAIKRTEKSIIAELKPRSPSEGDLMGNRDVLSLAGAYEQGGATALSVITSPYFGGKVETVSRVKSSVSIPVLAKDFVVDEYQVRQSLGYGADAVLLIEGISPVEELLDLVAELGLEAVVECHSAEEIEAAVNAGAELIGINNRDLRTFTVDLETTAILSSSVPEDRIMISESGVKTPADARYLFESGADALLIGTALMRSANPGEFIRACKYI